MCLRHRFFEYNKYIWKEKEGRKYGGCKKSDFIF